MTALPRIFLSVQSDPLFPEDIRGTAIAQDGTELWTFLYPSGSVALAAMRGNLRQYREHYPAGYQLVRAEDDPAGFAAATERARLIWQADYDRREAARHADMERVGRERQAPVGTEDVSPELGMLREVTRRVVVDREEAEEC